MKPVHCVRCRAVRLWLLLGGVFIAGCAGQVRVTDATGKPLQGAMVMPVAASINGDVVQTDSSGQATVPLNSTMQQTKWFIVSRAGYHDQHVAVPSTWPLHVILVPAAK